MAEVTLADLLRYKKEISINNPQTGELVKKVWIRILGDLDLTKSYKAARIASSAKRAALRDPSTDDYKDEVLGVTEMTAEEQRDIIKTANLSNIVSQAAVAVERPEPPKLEEFAVEPDAASLEELEKFDAEEADVEKTYQQKIDEYIQIRLTELESELSALSPEDLLLRAQQEVSVLVPFSMFMTELNAQKAFWGTFQDKACQVREFTEIEDFRQLPREIQDYIIEEINNLEVNGADIKN